MDHWYDTLIEYGVDEAARISFFLLAQVSYAGYKEANGLLYRMLGFRNEPIECTSAFIAHGVESARRMLNPEGGNKYGGKATRTKGSGKGRK